MGKLLDLFLFFLRLGTFSFGGPASHIRMMENELVKKQHLVTKERFDTIQNQINRLPGLSNTQMAMRLGYELGGYPGFILAGLGFILPGCLLMLIAGLYYQELRGLPVTIPFLYGIKAAVIAILIYTSLMHGARYFKDIRLLLLFIVVAAAAMVNINPLLLLGLSAVLMIILQQTNHKGQAASTLILLQNQVPNLIPLIDDPKILLSFFKIGLLVFGSGFLIIAYGKIFLVDQDIITAEVLLESVAFGLFAPGPLVSLATFLGFQIHQWNGALFATIGYFIAIVLYALIGKFHYGGLTESKSFRQAIRGLTTASLAILFAISVMLGYETFRDYKLWILCAVNLIILFRWRKLNPIWLIIISANIGYLILHFFPEQ